MTFKKGKFDIDWRENGERTTKPLRVISALKAGSGFARQD